MNTLGQAWNRVWFAPFDPLSAGLFRILQGMLLVGYYLCLLPNYARYFAPDGLFSKGTEGERPFLSLFTWLGHTIPMPLFGALGLIAALGYTLGWRTRFWQVLLFLLLTSQVHTNNVVTRGEELVFRMTLFLGLFAPLGQELSVDAWRRRRAGLPEPPLPTIWAVRLIQVQVALIYVFSLPRKLVETPDWREGTAIYWIMLNEDLSRWPWPSVYYGTQGELLSALFSYGTVCIQGSFPLAVWFRSSRGVVLSLATMMHLGIALSMKQLVFFSLAMVVCYALYIPGESLRRFLPMGRP